MSMTKQKKSKPTLRVFLSYAAADSADTLKVRSLLAQQPNLRIFTRDTLSAGEDWVSKLKNELSSCDIFMVLLSPNSVGSSWVLQELGAAWALEKPIIPVVTHPAVLTRIPMYISEA